MRENGREKGGERVRKERSKEKNRREKWSKKKRSRKTPKKAKTPKTPHRGVDQRRELRPRVGRVRRRVRVEHLAHHEHVLPSADGVRVDSHGVQNAVRVVAGGLAGRRAVEGPVGEVLGVAAGHGLLDDLGLGAHLVEDGALLGGCWVVWGGGSFLFEPKGSSFRGCFFRPSLLARAKENKEQKRLKKHSPSRGRPRVRRTRCTLRAGPAR